MSFCRRRFCHISYVMLFVAASVAENLKKVVPKTLSSQMVYTNSGLKFKAKKISCNVPNISRESMDILFAPLGIKSYGRFELTEESMLFM